ncbi:hypothetical protein Tco_0077361 [Tanacetum coccineum]
MLPPPDYSHVDSPFYTSVGLRMAFDPTKSLNYKVVHVRRTSSHIDIQTYCSETGNWKLCRDWFNFFSFDHFDSAIYWNEGKLFETHGCFLAVLRDYIGSREFTIYEMRKWCSVWSVREEDSCLVINLSGKVVEYNLISKTLHEIYDIGSNQLDDDELIPPFAADHNVYEFIPSFASILKFSPEKALWRIPSLLPPPRQLRMSRSCSLAMVCFCTGSGWPACYYVFNPSTNLFKRPPDYSHVDSPFYLSAGLRMAFDPTKSCNYKVVHARQTSSHIDIQTYCSETRNWCLCSDRFPFSRFFHFNCAIYLNGALHWINLNDMMDGLMHFKLNIEDHDQPILTSIKIHQGLHQGRHYFGSREFTIYKMRKGCSVWSVRYLVNTDDFMNPLPEGWSIWSTVWSIVLGEREDDSCLVINLSRKVATKSLVLLLLVDFSLDLLLFTVSS